MSSSTIEEARTSIVVAKDDDIQSRLFMLRHGGVALSNNTVLNECA